MKYRFTGQTNIYGFKQIVALRDIPRLGIKAGDIGGWIEKESNLSQLDDLAWVFGSAQVSGEARVSGSAQVSGEAWVFGSAQVFGSARVQATCDYIVLQMSPYSITITKQNIAIGCQLRSRFGKNQWNLKDPMATEMPHLIKTYKPILSFLKKQLPAKKAGK